jgi:LysM repeat protein
MGKKFKVVLICSLLISLGAIAVASGYFFSYKNKKNSINEEKTTLSTVDWKNYQNSKYGYQIKYPNDWQILEDADSQVVKIYFPSDSAKEKLSLSGKVTDGIIITLKDNSSSLASRDWIEKNIAADSYQEKDLANAEINGSSATKINNLQDADYAIYLARENDIIELLAYQDQKGPEVEEIIQTFAYSPLQAKEDFVYKVKSGETLSFIASKFNIAWPQLVRYNKIKSPDQVYAGQLLKIPTDPNALPSKGTGFPLDLEIARYYQSLVDSGKDVWRLDPIKIAKRELSGKSGISENDDFRIISEDRLAGQITIEINQKDGDAFLAELVQPIRKGSGGIWMIESLKSK